MQNIRHLGISNFRAFNGEFEFDFKALTILTGANSSGKSSLIKAIRFLKENLTRNDTFDFNCFYELSGFDELNIGNFDFWVNKQSDTNQISFSLPWLFNYNLQEYELVLTYDKSKHFNSNAQISSIVIKEKDTSTVIINVDSNGHHFNVHELWERMTEYFKFKKEVHELISNLSSEVSNQFPELTIKDKNWPSRIVWDYVFLNKKIGYYPIDDNNYNAEFDTEKIKPTKEQRDLIKKIQSYSYTIETPLEEIYFHLSPKNNINFDSSLPLFKYDLSKLESNEIQTDDCKIKNELLENDLDCFVDLTKYHVPMLSKDTPYDYDESGSIQSNSRTSLIMNKLMRVFSGLSRYVENPNKILPNRIYYDFIDLLKRESNTNYDPYKLFIGVHDSNFLDFHCNLDLFLNDCILNSIKLNIDFYKSEFSKLEVVPAFRNQIAKRHVINGNLDFFTEIVNFLNNSDELKREAYIKKCNQILELTEIANRIEIEMNLDGTISTIYLFDKFNDKINLADYGHGISQIIPIILKIVIELSDKKVKNDRIYEVGERLEGEFSTIIIEEPETNLHPSLQSKLADLFVYFIRNYKCQFIIETHSEYIIRKLQLLSVNDSAGFIRENTKIYYFYHPKNIPEGEKQVYPINIRKDGSLSKNFGTGFFDESAELNLLLFIQSTASKN